ncbi:hypothetical protein BGX26_006738 [Mortierella sp. AD094]|nr:hypothetical protein BGX26_006738 [Mortierella sp. AD094]
MAGFLDKSYFLSWNAVAPSIPLQQMIFPWVENAYGVDNQYWEEQCLDEMNEIDESNVPPFSTRYPEPSSSNVEASGSWNTETNYDRDVAKAGFLRLLVRCRRIILQDAAYRLHYDENSRILDHNIFASPMLESFREKIGHEANDTSLELPGNRFVYATTPPTARTATLGRDIIDAATDTTYSSNATDDEPDDASDMGYASILAASSDATSGTIDTALTATTSAIDAAPAETPNAASRVATSGIKQSRVSVAG